MPPGPPMPGSMPRSRTRWTHVLRTADQLPAIATLNDERDNIGAALRYLADSQDPAARRAGLDLALDMAWYWQMTGAGAEASAWLSVALAATEGCGHPDRPWAERRRCP